MEEKVYVRPRFRKLNENDYMTFWALAIFKGF